MISNYHSISAGAASASTDLRISSKVELMVSVILFVAATTAASIASFVVVRLASLFCM